MKQEQKSFEMVRLGKIIDESTIAEDYLMEFSDILYTIEKKINKYEEFKDRIANIEDLENRIEMLTGLVVLSEYGEVGLHKLYKVGVSKMKEIGKQVPYTFGDYTQALSAFLTFFKQEVGEKNGLERMKKYK